MNLLKSLTVPLLVALTALSGCGRDQNGATLPVAPTTEGDGARVGGGGPAVGETERKLPLVFAGSDKGRPCRITLHKEWHEGGVIDWKNYRAEVSTSYEHDGEGLGKRTVRFAGTGGGKLLDWEDAASKQFLRLAQTTAGDSVVDPASFRVRWLHDDHHHDNTCINLKRVVMP